MHLLENIQLKLYILNTNENTEGIGRHNNLLVTWKISENGDVEEWYKMFSWISLKIIPYSLFYPVTGSQVSR